MTEPSNPTAENLPDADDLLRAYGAGEMTFQDLLDKFSALEKPPPRTAPKNWAEVYEQAEEGDPSIPLALQRHEYAGNITAAEEEILLAAYRKKNVPPSPKDDKKQTAVREPLQWHSQPASLSSEHLEYVAKSGRTYFLVREVQPPQEYPRDHTWYLADHTNDEWDNGMGIGFYPSVEAAKAAAEAYLDRREAARKTTLEEIIQYKEEAGEDDEVLAELRAEYERDFGENPDMDAVGPTEG